MRSPELIIGDPHDQPGLVDHIPDGVGPVQIVNFYHYRLWPVEKAHCAKCGARRHRDGFTVELDDGSVALAGSTCGADLWGERWTTVRKRFEVKLNEAGIILDVRDALSELEEIRAALKTKWQPVVDQLHAHQRRFKGMMGPLYNALQRAAVRPDHSLVVKCESALLIEGWAYFTTDDVPQKFQLALDQLDAAIGVGHGEGSELGVRTVNIGGARNLLDAIAHAARGLRRFFTQSPTHLHSIICSVNGSLAPSARSDDYFHPYPYAPKVRSVLDVAAGKLIGLPDDYPMLDTEPLRKLRDLKS